MDINDSVFAILNFEQFERFCTKFNIDPTEVKTNFDGWRKLVIYTKDRVFLFPRDPRGVEWLNVEILTYKFLNKIENLPIPKFISRTKDNDISFYEFAEVTRLKGIPYSKIENKIEFSNVLELQINLAQLFSIWHDISLNNIPKTISPR